MPERTIKVEDALRMMRKMQSGSGGGGIAQEIDPTVPSWAKQPNKPEYTAEEVGALPNTTKIPSKTSDLTNDSGFMTSAPITNRLYHSDGTPVVVTGVDGDLYFVRSAADIDASLGSSNYPWYKTHTKHFECTEGRITCLPSYENTNSYAANVYVGSTGLFTRTTNTSSRTIKHDIKSLSAEDIKAENLYDLDVVQFKYNEGIITNEDDSRYGKDLVGFIIEDMDEVYPIAVDKPSDDVKEWSWNVQYMIPPMLKLIQDQHKEIEILKDEVQRINQLAEKQATE